MHAVHRDADAAVQCAMSETAAHAPPFRTNPSAHDRHRVASHETRVERVAARVALLVPQIVPASHATHPSALSISPEHPAVSFFPLHSPVTVMKCSSLHVTHDAPSEHVAHSSMHARHAQSER